MGSTELLDGQSSHSSRRARTYATGSSP
jgi:hypothetical protein